MEEFNFIDNEDSDSKKKSDTSGSNDEFKFYDSEESKKDSGIPMWMQLAAEGTAGAGLYHLQKAGYKAGTVPSSIYNMESALGSRTPLMLSQLGTATERAERIKQLEDWAKRLGNDKAIDMFLPKNPVASPEPPNLLKPLPEGGTGTENYAAKFGATPAQARTASSMQEVQGKIIPSNMQAAERLSGGVGKGYQLYDLGNGSTAWLTPEQAQAMNEQRANVFQSQTDQAKAIQDKAQRQLEQQRARASANVARARPAADAASQSASQTMGETQAIRQRLASELSTLPPALREAYESGSKFIGPMGKVARVAAKYLGPVAAAGAPFSIAQGYQTMQGPESADKARGAAEIGGGVGGLATLAPWLARAGLMAPELAAGTAATGGILAIPALAYALHDLYKAHPPASQDQAAGYEVAPPY
jgi:hypothetical protein